MISVIIPYKHNEDYEKRLYASLNSIHNQSCDPLEVIVSEVGEERQIELNKDIKHLLVPDDPTFKPSKARNYAAKESEGDTLYFTDADVFFHDPNCLKKLSKDLNQTEDSYLTSPKMLRLCRREFENFYSTLQDKGFGSLISSLDIEDEYLATLDHKSEIEVFTKEENGKKEVQLADKRDLKKYLETNKENIEPLFWTLNVHRGGLMVPKDYFQFIGGYAQKYEGWGCEDDDINWKLNQFFDRIKIESPVIHLDHSRDYFVKEQWLENMETLDQRKEDNTKEIIKNDREEYKKI